MKFQAPSEHILQKKSFLIKYNIYKIKVSENIVKQLITTKKVHRSTLTKKKNIELFQFRNLEFKATENYIHFALILRLYHFYILTVIICKRLKV